MHGVRQVDELAYHDLTADHRVMLCGSPGLPADLRHILERRGFREGNTSTPGDFVIERAFAEK